MERCFQLHGLRRFRGVFWGVGFGRCGKPRRSKPRCSTTRLLDFPNENAQARMAAKSGTNGVDVPSQTGNVMRPLHHDPPIEAWKQLLSASGLLLAGDVFAFCFWRCFCLFVDVVRLLFRSHWCSSSSHFFIFGLQGQGGEIGMVACHNRLSLNDAMLCGGWPMPSTHVDQSMQRREVADPSRAHFLLILCNAYFSFLGLVTSDFFDRYGGLLGGSLGGFALVNSWLVLLNALFNSAEWAAIYIQSGALCLFSWGAPAG